MSLQLQASSSAPEEDELNIINVISIQLMQEASQTQDLSQVVALSLHGRNIVKLQALSLCPNLRTLDLSFNCIRRLEGLETLSKLKELKLYDNHISSLQGLAGLGALHTLDVSGNKLTSLQGVASLRGLRVLRCAHNPHLTSFDGFGRAGAIEVLDLSHGHLPDLSGLTAAVSLRELNVAGNKLVNLKGLQRCDQLQELHAAFNALSSLQGLKSCAATLEVLDVRGNRLTSLDSLADGCSRLHELYASDNAISSLASLAAKAPALETLDVARNQLQLGNSSSDAALQQLLSQLSGLAELSWVHAEGNCAPQGYQSALLAALPQLDGVDEQPRPDMGQQPDVWVNPADAGPDPELRQLLSHVEPAALLPTVDEMEAFKQAMNINSQLPPIGLQQQQQHDTVHRDSSTGDEGQAVQPPSTGGFSRPMTASREELSSRGRPGSAAMRVSMQRPGSAMGMQGSGPAIKDVMMHQRMPSARTGGVKRLMTPDQYAQAVADFGGCMAQYSTSLQATLATMKAGLKLTMGEAAQQIRAPEGVAARQLPVMPIMPAMPTNMTRDKVLGPTGNALLSKPQYLTPAFNAAGGISNHAAGGGRAAQKARAAELAVARDALQDPGADAALQHFHRLYATPDADRDEVENGEVGGMPTQAATGQQQQQQQQALEVHQGQLRERSKALGTSGAACDAEIFQGSGSGALEDRDVLICDDDEGEDFGVNAGSDAADVLSDHHEANVKEEGSMQPNPAQTSLSHAGDEASFADAGSGYAGQQHQQHVQSATHASSIHRTTGSAQTVQASHGVQTAGAASQLSACAGTAVAIQQTGARLVWKGSHRPISAGKSVGIQSQGPAGDKSPASAAAAAAGSKVSPGTKAGKLTAASSVRRDTAASKQQQSGVVISHRGMKARLVGHGSSQQQQ